MSGRAIRYTRNGALEFATELGMDTERFSECIEDKRHLPILQRMQQSALQRGIRGTPTITVNGEPVGNAPGTIIRRVRELAGVE